MLALVGAIAATAPVSAEPPCRARLCFAGTLAPFLRRLREARRDSPIHILQIGDSHSAGDMITQGWRVRLQARYGNAGRGVLAAGRPYAGYLTFGVTAAQSGGWSVSAILGGGEGAPLGLSGFTQTARAAGESLSVTTDTPDQDFDRVIVCALTGPGMGTIALRLGTQERVWRLGAASGGPACRTMDSQEPVSSAALIAQDSDPVSITSFATLRRGGGAILSNLGVVGAQSIHFARASDAVVRAELAAYRPDLIVLAFGTNEAFFPAFDPDSYEAALRAQIARLRGLAGGDVPILLLGPPDSATRQAGGGPSCGERWFTPARLSEVRDRQMRVASGTGAAFWDWQGAMGGRCAALGWQRAGLMRGDLVHFTRAGGDRIGAMIDADLARAAEGAR
jgi:lysophospholipase L1-like esterase